MNKKFVLDTNCIIDLEENRPDAQHLRVLVNAWKNGYIDLAVVAVSASENQPTKVSSPSYAVFEAKLRNVGLIDAHELMPMGIWDVFYWDHFLWSSPEMETLALKIRAILFPGIAAIAPVNIEENSKWRNQMCDVLVAWSSIHHSWPILVTRDANFHRHGAALAVLGIKEVLYPADAVRLYVP